MRKLPLLGLTVVTLGACASTAPGVRITENPQATAGCTFIGEVTAVNTWAESDTRKKLTAEVARLGGDTLFMSTRPQGPGPFKLHGEAYRCQQVKP
jgi:hypothetical protein